MAQIEKAKKSSTPRSKSAPIAKLELELTKGATEKTIPHKDLGPSPQNAEPTTQLKDKGPKQRYVISHLLSVHRTEQQREDAAQIFNSRVQKVILSCAVNVAFDSGAVISKDESGSENTSDDKRRVMILDADAEEITAIAANMTPDSVIEPELLRVPAVAYPAGLLVAAPPNTATAPSSGNGDGLRVRLVGPDGQPVAGSTAFLRLNGIADPAASTTVGGISANDGMLSIAFDNNVWRPALLALEPVTSIWTFVTNSPQSGQTYTLKQLPTGDSLGWWHMLTGAVNYDADAGKGIKVGIVDSGVGPHPYLTHVTPVGSFLDGSFQGGAPRGIDAQMHGTHVSGIIAARPAEGTKAYGGIAAGSDVYMARVFSSTGGGNQGDIANAIDALSGEFGVDLINLSLVGAPSAIEHDAVIAAFQRGTLCICAAGNQSGSMVGSPASYPECVAVGALGLLGQAPSDSMSAFNVPTTADKFTQFGIFLASFSNVGPQIFCAAPGNGIVSTIPARAKGTAPYADMSGTSMASPLTTGALASLLAKDNDYLALPRNAARAAYAKALLAKHMISIGLQQTYQGYGLPREM